MRRPFIILTMTPFGFTAVPSFDNNWQWQLDMSPDNQRRNTETSTPAKPTSGK